MKNLKVSKKLILSFGAILLLFAISSIIVTLGLTRIKDQLDSFYTGPWESRYIANKISTAIADQQKYLYKAIATTDSNIITPSLKEVDNLSEQLQELLLSLEEKAQATSLPIIKELESKVAQWDTIKADVLKLTADTTISSDEISKYMQEHSVRALDEVSTSVDNLLNLANQVGDNFIHNINSAQYSAIVLLIIMCSVSIVLGIILCIYITKGITRPIKEIEKAANQIEEGQLKISIEYSSKDELGVLAKSMQNMANRINYYMDIISSAVQQIANKDLDVKRRDAFLGDFIPVQQAVRQLITSLDETLLQINQSATQVAAGSEQISSGAQALSQGAMDQASSVEELAATIDEISNQIQNSAANAAEANKKADSVGQEMNLSNKKMQEMIQAMNHINLVSKEIGNIIQTIDDIATQTNLLALNAAIEAARAGAAGKGFAVVADEIRVLASGSSEASKNISALIGESLKAVEDGTEIAKETAGSLEYAVQGALEVASTIGKISKAADEQADSIKQIIQGADQISTIVQANSATAEEFSASSQELSSQSHMLRSLVGQFKLISTGSTIS